LLSFSLLPVPLTDSTVTSACTKEFGGRSLVKFKVLV